MDFTNITKVKQLRDAHDVDRYLNNGWKLLAVLQYRDDSDGVAFPVYTVGWCDTENAVEPQSTYPNLD